MKIYQSAILFISGLLLWASATHAQLGREIKWLRIGSMHHYIVNWGAEIEMGRTGRVQEQMDGLRWPAQFQNQDVLVAKALWIGCKDYQDRNGVFYPYKVITVGPRAHDEYYQFIPNEKIRLVGRFHHPTVYVDGVSASDNDLNDVVDEIDESLPCDRMVINKLITYLGIEVTRKVMQFGQQYHDNYIIYDYVFKNTGVVDLKGTTDSRTLNGVYFYLMYRYGSGLDAFRAGSLWYPSNNINWGRNTVNQVVGIGPKLNAFEERAQYSWYGPHSMSPVDDWGGPNPRDGRLSAVHYVGTVILHADTAPNNPADDRSQPSTTQFIGSDTRPATYGADQFVEPTMTSRYTWMSAGHPAVTHADQVGEGFADLWGDDAGGQSQGQGFGPYTLAPGDSIHIVLAEGVAGIERRKSVEVGRNWYQWHASTGQPTLELPDGNQTSDYNLYKKLWVKTGEDSILQTFRRAADIYENSYSIPLPPPPPEIFEVNSGGDRIILTWSNNAESYPHFDGYEIHRGVGKPDTLFEKIFSCNRANAVNRFEDRTAIRGLDHYYYIVSKDDGSQNALKPGVPLESSRFYTMTNEPAFLRKPAVRATLDSIRVVPNPFNMRASALQFGTNTPDRLGFYGLPPECVIKIYTERGELIDTIIHDDGTADELWDSLTSSRQVIVSGVYIAYFEVTQDLYSATGERLFQQGDHQIRKFFVIR